MVIWPPHVNRSGITTETLLLVDVAMDRFKTTSQQRSLLPTYLCLLPFTFWSAMAAVSLGDRSGDDDEHEGGRW